MLFRARLSSARWEEGGTQKIIGFNPIKARIHAGQSQKSIQISATLNIQDECIHLVILLDILKDSTESVNSKDLV